MPTSLGPGLPLFEGVRGRRAVDPDRTELRADAQNLRRGAGGLNHVRCESQYMARTVLRSPYACRNGLMGECAANPSDISRRCLLESLDHPAFPKQHRAMAHPLRFRWLLGSVLEEQSLALLAGDSPLRRRAVGVGQPLSHVLQAV